MKKTVEGFENVASTPFNPTEENQAETAGTLMTMDEDSSFVADLTTRQTTFCSMVAKTVQEKALLFKAMNNPEKRLGDCINMKIMAKDLFCEVVTCINQQTGAMQDCPRMVIIDENGVGYQAVSLGVYSGIKKLIQVFGEPTWEEPLPLVVKQITKGEKKLLTFDLEY